MIGLKSIKRIVTKLVRKINVIRKWLLLKEIIPLMLVKLGGLKKRFNGEDCTNAHVGWVFKCPPDGATH